MRWSYDPGPQVRAEWFKKYCGPRKGRRLFDPGGAESGTLAGARRAPGLFDENWDREFPLTRKERETLAAGGQVLDPFFAPPTTPNPGNWIEDKIKRIRGTFGPTLFQTPKAYTRFCKDGGFGITCAGPDGEVGWTGGTVPLTPLDVDRFREAYCSPGQCQTAGKVAPPSGYTEFVVKTTPRNPAVRLKASCQPVLAAEPVIMDVPLPPGAPAVAPPADWSCAASERGCVGMNCVVRGESRTMHWKSGVPPSVIQDWWVANCGAGV
jgi:hypothetical protein